MPNRTLVPDKLQGYLLQVRHMLYELISVDDRIVSIEKLDDVAVEADGKVIAEQVKSVTSANNPISILLAIQCPQSVLLQMIALQFCKCTPKMGMYPPIRKKRESVLLQRWDF